MTLPHLECQRVDASFPITLSRDIEVGKTQNLLFRDRVVASTRVVLLHGLTMKFGACTATATTVWLVPLLVG
eukprot:scaffold6750_cov160-Amphora_coffeaeformis.AAC.18